MLKLRKTSRTYKDFSKSFYEVWADAFHNYTTILVSLFGREVPDLHSALAEFYNNIYELSKVYEWQEAVLPMAIEAHTFIITKQPTDPSKWVIPEKFQGRFCTVRTMIGMGSIMRAGVKKKRSRSPQAPAAASRQDRTTCWSVASSSTRAGATGRPATGPKGARGVGRGITGCRSARRKEKEGVDNWWEARRS